MITFKKKDILILLFIMLFSTLFIVLFYSLTPLGNIAIIEKNGEQIKRIDLSKVDSPYIIEIDAKYPAKILVEKGKISFYEAQCPDKLCKKYGKISRKGQNAICLPSGIVIRIENSNNKIDSITG